MKIIIGAALAIIALQSCKHSSEKNNNEPAVQPVEKQSFFPVTEYIKGQLFEISKKGVNPLKYQTINDHTDSVWVKMEELPAAINEFLHPEIDSLNLTSLFTEKKFMDQSIDAITFTYDPIGILPDSMTLKHWDVYVDPATGRVRRIYMVKYIGETRVIQLTWQGDKWCKITTIINRPDGTSAIEKEEKITWDF